MARRQDENHILSRRKFLRSMRWAPAFFLPAPFHGITFPFQSGLRPVPPDLPLSESRLTPHYPTKSPLDNVIRLVAPGTDEFITEKYASEMENLLAAWSHGLTSSAPALGLLAEFVDSGIQATALATPLDTRRNTGGSLEVWRRQFPGARVSGRERFLEQMKNYLAPMSRLETAEFLIVGLEVIPGPATTFRADIHYDMIGTGKDIGREERIGRWKTEWTLTGGNEWRVSRWEATEETVSRARGPVFIDITQQALGQTESYRVQMLRGVDHWRTVLDAACGIEIYGNNGLAAGDFDNDGLDDLYVCQPSGLPNRLYRNRGDGRFEDVTERSGVDVLDATACAMFADFENKGLQDLLVVCANGPLFFVNQGNGRFSRKRDAFKFAQPPQGTFTHAALVDYDADGRLDIYFC
jgi:hypothetical protein